eukprot:CFRG7881T1
MHTPRFRNRMFSLVISCLLFVTSLAQLSPPDQPEAREAALKTLLPLVKVFGNHDQPRSTHPGSIFVSIVSFRDDQLTHTVMDLLDKAKDTSRIVFGILTQDKTELMEAQYTFERRSDFNGKVVRMDWKKTKGTCWARHAVQELLFNNETYYMQLDSHHRFVHDWDERSISELRQAKEMSEKPILTQYLNGFQPEHEKKNASLESSSVTTLTAVKYYETGKARIQPSHHAGPFSSPQLEIALVSGHFIFCDGSWVYEIPYDPYLIFEGEEDTLGMRSYTHGWDMYHTSVSLAFHYYQRPESERFRSGGLATEKSEARLRRITGSPGPPSDFTLYPEGYDFGIYGNGVERTVEEYYRQSGIFWNKRFLHEKARRGDPTIVISEEEFQEIMAMTPWTVTRDCGGNSRESCFERGCRWVEGFPGPYCQYAHEPLKDCGYPGVHPHECAGLGGKWVGEEGPGPVCQYGIPEFPPRHQEL